ncbi:F-box protein CPR1-like [Rutidosis leptorrhynchoides]|uniref:F-box protein CPR1-like n=1 Tax=Rutidosis leptorrhynchoides TaxID=125765 RepID=UPI003A998F17
MDVVGEILARLDVEDVLRCKSVCKSWYNYLSTSYFVNKVHLKHSINRNREHGDLRIQLHYKFFYSTNNMVGSCNGLVCISFFKKRDRFLVTNPSTREVRELPMLLPYKFNNRVVWGFGYDSTTDDYKVVFGSDKSNHHMGFQVLSLKSNKWKYTVGECDDYLTYNAHHRFLAGVLYDGALHWFVNDMKKNKTVILSYDLSLDKFKEVPQPCDAKYVCGDEHENILGVFEGCLCIIRPYDLVSDDCHAWVMRNYNCWQMLPHDYQGNKYAAPAATIAYKLDRLPNNTWRLCDDDKGNVDLSSQDWFNIPAPIYVKSLVSPYLFMKPSNNNNNNKRELDSSFEKPEKKNKKRIFLSL